MEGQDIRLAKHLKHIPTALLALILPAVTFGDPIPNVVPHPVSNEPEIKAKPAGPFRPKSFNRAEIATLEVLSESIMPGDKATPGAKQAKVAEFIDFQAEYDEELRGRFRHGLKWLDKHSKKLHGKPFTKLAANQRNEILDALAYKAMYRPGEEEGRDFYKLMRRYTEMGFYTSKVGMETLKRPERYRAGGSGSRGSSRTLNPEKEF